MDDKKMLCEICNRRFVLDELIPHYFSHIKNKNYPCKFCDLVFKKILDLNLHLQSFHKISRSYNCPKCRKKLLCLYEFFLHLRKIHANQKKVPSTKSESEIKLKSEQKDKRKDFEEETNCSVINTESNETCKDVNADLAGKISSDLQIFPVSQKNSITPPVVDSPSSSRVCNSSLEITPICKEKSSPAKKPVNKVLITVVPKMCKVKDSVLHVESNSDLVKDKSVTVRIVNNSALMKQNLTDVNSTSLNKNSAQVNSSRKNADNTLKNHVSEINADSLTNNLPNDRASLSKTCQLFQKRTYDHTVASNPKNPLWSTAKNIPGRVNIVHISSDSKTTPIKEPSIVSEGLNEHVGQQTRGAIPSHLKGNISCNNLNVNPLTKSLNGDTHKVKSFIKTANCTSPNDGSMKVDSYSKPDCLLFPIKEQSSDKSSINTNLMQKVFLNSETEMKRTTFVNKSAIRDIISACEMNKETLFRTELIEKNEANAKVVQHSHFSNESSIESNDNPKAQNAKEQINEKVFTYRIVGKVSFKNRLFSKKSPYKNQATSEKTEEKLKNAKKKDLQNVLSEKYIKARDIKLIKKYLQKQKMQLLQECKELLKNSNPDDFPVLKSISTYVTQRDIDKFLPSVLLTRLPLHQYVSNFKRNAKVKNVNISLSPKVNSRCVISPFTKPIELNTVSTFDRSSVFEMVTKKNLRSISLQKIEKTEVCDTASELKSSEIVERKSSIVFLKNCSSRQMNDWSTLFVGDKSKEPIKTYNKKTINDILNSSDSSKVNSSPFKKDDSNKCNNISKETTSHFKTPSNCSLATIKKLSAPSDLKVDLVSSEMEADPEKRKNIRLKTSLHQSSETTLSISTRKKEKSLYSDFFRNCQESKDGTKSEMTISNHDMNKPSAGKIVLRQSLEISCTDPHINILNSLKKNTLSEVHQNGSEATKSSSSTPETLLESKFWHILGKCGTEITSSSNQSDVKNQKRLSQEQNIPPPKKQMTEIKGKSSGRDLLMDPILLNAKRAWQIHLEAEKNLKSGISKLKENTKRFSFSSIDLLSKTNDTFTINCPCGAFECNGHDHDSSTDCEYVLY